MSQHMRSTTYLMNIDEWRCILGVYPHTHAVFANAADLVLVDAHHDESRQALGDAHCDESRQASGVNTAELVVIDASASSSSA